MVKIPEPFPLTTPRPSSRPMAELHALRTGRTCSPPDLLVSCGWRRGMASVVGQQMGAADCRASSMKGRLCRPRAERVGLRRGPLTGRQKRCPTVQFLPFAYRRILILTRIVGVTPEPHCAPSPGMASSGGRLLLANPKIPSPSPSEGCDIVGVFWSPGRQDPAGTSGVAALWRCTRLSSQRTSGCFRSPEALRPSSIASGRPLQVSTIDYEFRRGNGKSPDHACRSLKQSRRIPAGFRG